MTVSKISSSARRRGWERRRRTVKESKRTLVAKLTLASTFFHDTWRCR